MGCTTLLVGKDATLDGSTFIARNEDSGSTEFLPKRAQVVQPADQPRHYEAAISHVKIELPDDPMRYTSLPDAISDHGIWAAAGVNEANVGMTATETLTSNERVLGADPLVEYRAAKGKPGEEGYEPEVAGGIGEEDIVTLVLPYIHSVREGVERLGALLGTYGTYEMNGIAFSDTDEIWWLETVGGHHWIARRVPDDAYVVMPNQLGIDAFDLTDAEGDRVECMASPDLREFIEKNHLDRLDARSDEPGCADAHVLFNPLDAFGSHSDSDHVYNTPRAWDMHRFLSPHMDWTLADGEGWGPEADDLPWCLPPERPVSVEDVKYVLSLHYQGTPYDPYGHYGDDSQRGKYRPIGINRNGQLDIIQLRPYAPEATRSVEWVAFGSNVFNTVVPLYSNVDASPEYLSNTTGRVSTESFYWANRLVAALADAHWRECACHVERYQQAVVAAARAIVNETDERVAAAGLGYADATPVLQQANERICAMLREQTDDLLSKVLLDASLKMRNGFARSDA